MKKTFIAMIALLAFIFTTAPVYAECAMKGGDCSAGKGHGQMAGDDEDYQCPVTAKFFKKASFLLGNQTELGLSDEQGDTIKALKMDVKKTYIQQMADMQVWMLEIEAKMSTDKINVDELNDLIDKGSASMTASVKKVVAAYAKLKAVLNNEQVAKAKTIWKGKKH